MATNITSAKTYTICIDEDEPNDPVNVKVFDANDEQVGDPIELSGPGNCIDVGVPQGGDLKVCKISGSSGGTYSSD